MNQTIEKTISMGYIIRTGNQTSALPLEHTAVAAQVTGMLAVVSVSQRFGNPYTEPMELEYLFPLPEKSSLVDFELQIGTRLIKAELQELEQARKTFEEARLDGNRAGLLEQRRPNLFAVRLANVMPGETIQTTLRYQERLKFEDGFFEFVFPMGITPKYTSPLHPEEGKGVEFPLAHPEEKIGTVEICLAVDAGVSVASPTSPTHPLAVARLDERRFQVQLAEKCLPDHDFVLRYALSGKETLPAFWSVREGDNEIFMAAVFPPALDETFSQPEPREFVFVLDRSGSMSVEPIAQARNALRAALRTLNPEDTFRILLFDDQLEWYQAEPARMSQEEVIRADRFLAGVDSRGGTELVAALRAALELPVDPKRKRLVVFLTDGAVSAEERALKEVRNQLGKAHLFTFGIGPAVNRALLRNMAELGHGTAEFLQLDEDIEGALIRFQDRVSFPVLGELKLEWRDADVWDVLPEHFPDLYVGQPLEICGRMKRRSGKTPALMLKGKAAGHPVEIKLEIPAASSNETVRRVWARARLEDLMEKMADDPSQSAQDRAEIISLGLEYRLVTPYTAFVAVEHAPANPSGKMIRVEVSQPLPPGLSRDAFMPPMQTLTVPSPAAFKMRGRLHAATNATTGAVPPPQILASAGIGSDLDLPAFLKRRISRDTEPVPQEEIKMGVELPASGDLNSILRWLMRTQNVDGSWGGDVERTSAALLAFIRSGNTSRRGSYRKVVGRAAAWLVKQAAAARGWAKFSRALALFELARADGEAAVVQESEDAIKVLPSPSSPFETAVVERIRGGQPGIKLQAVSSLDDLRLAGSVSTAVSVPKDLLEGEHAALVYTWMGAFLALK